jgi:hypothetical protein
MGKRRCDELKGMAATPLGPLRLCTSIAIAADFGDTTASLGNL